MKIILQAKINKSKANPIFQMFNLGGEMNHIDTYGSAIAFINQHDNSITYCVDKNTIVEFEFGSNYYNVIIKYPHY